MKARALEALRNFVAIAGQLSLSKAAEELCITKGALSHQIKRLEDELGFDVFKRHPRGIKLTPKGSELLDVAENAFGLIEGKIAQLQGVSDRTLTIGVTTYFASRWLSPRLMSFMQNHPDIRLLIQPMIDLANFAGEDVDIAIRWGRGNWTDCEVEELFLCPAWPAGNREALTFVEEVGLEKAFAEFTLLRDRKDSNAWSEWYTLSGFQNLIRRDTLIIPDPNVRVQAVYDGQGVAFFDDLISDELENERLFRLSTRALEDYGYFLAYQNTAQQREEVVKFVQWIKDTR